MGAKSSRNNVAHDASGIFEGLKNDSYKNVIVMCGAGISTSAGIPDFRSPSAGIYFKLKRMEGLPYPEAVFDGDFFGQNPVPFYQLVRELYPKKLCPTTTHKFLALLQQKGILRRVYTQNIDALEFLAGVHPDKVVEAHGTFQRSYCTSCRQTFDLAWLTKQIFNPQSDADGVPRCSECRGVVRPDVVLFGEALPSRFWQLLSQDFSACDLLMVFGTSLSVAPFNSLVNRPGSQVPRLFVNRTWPGSSGSLLEWAIGSSVRISFRQNDVVVLDDCDAALSALCDGAGWLPDLQRVPIRTLDM